jgi:uncharacterized protein (DUF342 family)
MASDDPRSKDNTCAENPDGGAPSAADAQVRFCLSEDGLKLGISRYKPPGPGGRPLTKEGLRQALTRAGVQLPPSEAAMDKVLLYLEQNKAITGIALVRGKAAVEPRDAFLEPMGDHARPVFPGDIVAIKHAPAQPEPGYTIDGRDLQPSSYETARDIIIPAEGLVSFNPADDTVRSRIYGLAEAAADRAQVRPLITLSPDKSQAFGVIHATDSLGRPVTLERLALALKAQRIVKPLIPEAAEQALALAKAENRAVEGVLLAQGVAPEPGADGFLELLVRGRDLVGKESQTGRLDYRERGSHPSVQAGQDFARLHPPGKGKPGVDVFDKPIAAPDGQPLNVSAGPGVTALENGTLFRAEMDGIVVHQGGVLSITESLVVEGDVSLATGNIRVEKGAVTVHGSVQAGFVVQAAGHVVVRDVVESCTVEAKGNVEVGGGILMPKGGQITAEGHVTAQFATNARITAAEDVVIGNEINHCLIRTPGQILCTKGKGIIQGGVLVCGLGLECNELGSELGVTTVVGVSIRTDDDQAALAERKALKEEIERIDLSVGGDLRAFLENTPPEKKAAAIKLVRYRAKKFERFKEITRQLAEQVRKRQQEFAQARIRVRRVAHPGVTIKIAGRSLVLSAPVERVSFHYDAQTREIVSGNL